MAREGEDIGIGDFYVSMEEGCDNPDELFDSKVEERLIDQAIREDEDMGNNNRKRTLDELVSQVEKILMNPCACTDSLEVKELMERHGVTQHDLMYDPTPGDMQLERICVLQGMVVKLADEEKFTIADAVCKETEAAIHGLIQDLQRADRMRKLSVDIKKLKAEKRNKSAN